MSRVSLVGPAAAFLLLTASALDAQWLKQPTAGIPRSKDGKPNLVNFEYKNGVYVAEKILSRGYLAIGKQKLGFTKDE